VRDRHGDPLLCIIPVYQRPAERGSLWKGMTHWYFSQYVALSLNYRARFTFD